MNELKNSMFKCTKIFASLVAVVVADIACKLIFPIAMGKKIDFYDYIDNCDMIFAFAVVTAIMYYFEHRKLKRIIATLEKSESNNDYKEL